jgi:hypothetical protein
MLGNSAICSRETGMMMLEITKVDVSQGFMFLELPESDLENRARDSTH